MKIAEWLSYTATSLQPLTDKNLVEVRLVALYCDGGYNMESFPSYEDQA